MASDSEIKRREAIALDRVTKAAENLAARFPEIDTPTIPIRHRYPELLPLIRMEALADFLDAIDAALETPEPTPDATTAPPVNDEDTTDYASWNVLALSQFAETIGVEKVGSLRSKQALIDAIKARTSREKAD